jgi:hypothetical protein
LSKFQKVLSKLWSKEEDMMTTIILSDIATNQLLEELTQIYHHECVELNTNKGMMQNTHYEVKTAFRLQYPNIQAFLDAVCSGKVCRIETPPTSREAWEMFRAKEVTR